MVFRKFLAALCVLLALSSLTASAITAAKADNSELSPALTVKEDWKAKAEAANSKWKKLPENQKKEVYALLDQKAADEIKLMEKYRELGIIDDSVLAKFKSIMKSKIDAIKDSGEFPLFAEKNIRHEGIPKEKKTL